jgi:hypothetical protein
MQDASDGFDWIEVAGAQGRIVFLRGNRAIETVREEMNMCIAHIHFSPRSVHYLIL